MRTLVWTRALGAASLTLMLAGCGSRASEPTAEAKTTPRNPLEITLRPDLMQKVKIGEPQWTQVSATLIVAGRVEADETRLARVGAPVNGRIVELEVVEGQHVKRGQVLATIHSTELAGAQSAFLKAFTQKQLAARAVARARQLLDAGVIGTAELQRREAELEEADTEVSSSRVQLNVLGMPEDAIQKLESGRTVNSITHILSTIEGRVLERPVTIGQVVQAAQTVCIVADLSNVWLVADVPEQSAGAISIGKSMEAEIPALPGLRVRGRLSYVSAIVNPETRTVRTRMNLPNPARRFKPAMLATMTLIDGAQRRLVVPPGATVREDNEDNVLLQVAPDRFVLHRVKLGAECREGRVLESGLDPGQKIIVEGAFHANNERKRLALQGDES